MGFATTMLPLREACYRMRRVASHLAVALVMATVAVGFGASPTAANPKYAAFVMDANTGQVYFARNADSRRFPASLTKIMTLYMVFQALDNGTLKLDQPLQVSRRAAGQPPSKLGLKAGRTITVEDAIKALSVKSANDVATVVAEAIGGTESNFARLMTQRARALGMRNTTFMNASGLPNSKQRSTARDMATLGKAMLDRFPHHYEYFSKLTYKHGKRTYRNHNKLLRSYEGMDGIKTGYIRASGFNLVASAERDGVRLIGVVFGGKTGQSRDAHMVSILNRSWARARTNSTVAALPLPKPNLDIIDTSHMDLPRPAAPADARQGIDWGVQIGAFRGFARARAAAGFTAKRLSDLPETATIQVSPLHGERETLYRARIVGMERGVAARVCRELRRTGAPCVMVTPDGDLQIAEAGGRS
ncbi:MAG: D-alanyl-D-alanine carboxypeptidase [Alphaproteobacteria bacterium]|nr:D-alanyl-D-alanine carboxypeptidase [Alphaproteobacteria bacterium]